MKKKGLIVATIVMVLVLAVSLTTATYAWFSSQAKATVENLAITTQPASGVQIAVYEGTGNSTKYFNGTISYFENGDDNTENLGNHWYGDADGFGMLLDFADIKIGTMVNAVTNNTKTGDHFYEKANVNVGDSVAGKYTISNDGKPSEATGNAVEGTTYYTRTECTAGNFYRPTGYNANIEPLGYYVAAPNTKDAGVGDDPGTWTSYYEIPLAMQAVKATNAIVCSIAIKNSAAPGTNLYPGMAAATRVRITAINSAGTAVGTSKVFQPFEGYKYSNGTMTVADNSKNTDGVLNFVVADGTIATTDVFKLLIEIWVEGTDTECHTGLTNVTNFDVDFSFDIYSAEDYEVGEDLTFAPTGGQETTYEYIAGVSQTVSAGA